MHVVLCGCTYYALPGRLCCTTLTRSWYCVICHSSQSWLAPRCRRRRGSSTCGVCRCVWRWRVRVACGVVYVCELCCARFHDSHTFVVLGDCCRSRSVQAPDDGKAEGETAVCAARVWVRVEMGEQQCMWCCADVCTMLCQVCCVARFTHVRGTA